MILRRKFQKGGSISSRNIFMAPEIYYGSAPNMPVTGSQSRDNAAANYRVSQQQSANSALPKGGLDSDIQYYNEEKARLEDQMKAIAEEKGIESPEYKAAVNQWYSLDKKVLPTLKSKEAIFKQSLQKVKTSKAVSAPAIMNGKVLVYDLANGNDIRVVDKYTLLKTPKNFRVMTVGDAATKRATDPTFSGYTPEGEFVDAMMNTVMGADEYDNLMSDRLKNSLGIHTDSAGNKYTMDNKKLKFNDNQWDQFGLGLIKASDKNVDDVISVLYNQSVPSEDQFLEAQAIQGLYSKLAALGTGLEGDDSIQEAVERSKRGILLRRLASYGKKGSGSGSGSKKSETIKIDPLQYTLLNLLSTDGTQRVETGALQEGELDSLVWDMPASIMPGGVEALTVGMEGEKQKTIGNSNFLKEATTGIGNITLADGTRLSDLLEGDDNKNVNGLSSKVTIAPDSPLYIMIAPIVKDRKGRDVVNFNSKYTQLIREATKEALGMMRDEGITEADLQTKSVRSDKVKEIEDKINKMFREKAAAAGLDKPDMRLGFAFAFKVLFDGDEDAVEQNRYVKSGLDGLEGILNISIPGTSEGTVSAATAFVPMSNSYRRTLYAENANKQYGLDSFAFDAPAFIESLGKTATTTEQKDVDDAKIREQVAGSTNRNTRDKIEEKKKGGKLATSDEVYNLLFK